MNKQQKPNGKAFCPGCGVRHPERPIITDTPPKEAKVCADCQIEWGAGLRNRPFSSEAPDAHADWKRAHTNQ